MVDSSMTSTKAFDIKMGREYEHCDLLSNVTNDAIWDHDVLTGRTYIAGTGYKQLFGYPVENEFIDQHDWETRIHPGDLEKVLGAYNAVITNDTIESSEVEYRLTKADASLAWVRDRFTVIREHGRVIRVVGAMQDITREKEETFRLKLLESALTHALDPVLILEMRDTQAQETIIYVNEAFARMSGFTQHEIIGYRLSSFFGPETNQTQIEKITDALQAKKTCKVEITNYKKDGSAYSVELAIAPITNDLENRSHFVVTVRDITERKIQELEQEQLVHELTQNNIDLRQFSYITSHNLRGPIASLLGLCGLLDHFEIEDPTLKQILDGVKKATHMFDGTIKDLTTVLNVRDRNAIPKQHILFSEVYNKTIAQSEVLIDYSGARVRSDFEKAPAVYYNNAYLESIFSNLITNAIKYRSPDRPLEILITTEMSENHVIMTFGDNGLGIDLERHKGKVFSLYQRFHDHTEGKGLGLFLIKSQLEALKGSIDIKSKVGEGTTFILKFARSQ